MDHLWDGTDLMHQQIMIALSTSGGAGAMPTFIGATASGVVASPSIGRAWPAGHAAGDLGIVALQTANVPINTPAGWDLIGQVGTGSSGTAASTRIALFGRIAESSAEPSTSFTSASGFIQGRMFVFRGTAASGYVDAYSDATGATSATISLPTVTTLGDNRLILYFLADGTDNSSMSRYSNWSNPSLSAITELGDAGTTTSTGGGYGLASGEKAGAGSIGAGSVDFALAASNYAAITLAIRPPDL